MNISALDIDQNGIDSNLGEDSDSVGNSATGATSAGKSGKSSITTPPAKEKKKPFFKKVMLGRWS